VEVEMFNYIIILGSGALTYLTVRKCGGDLSGNILNAFIELIVYVMLDMVTTYLCLEPLGRIVLINDLNGRYDLQYGNTAIIFSTIISIIWGIIFSFIRKNVKLELEIKNNKKE
jgi:hypothetical protein